MLSNQPGQGGPGGGGMPGGPMPGLGPGRPPPLRNPPTPGRAAGLPPLAEDLLVPSDGPAESARLRERTGLVSAADVPRLGLSLGPGAQAAASARGGFEVAHDAGCCSLRDGVLHAQQLDGYPPLQENRAAWPGTQQPLSQSLPGQRLFPQSASFPSSERPPGGVAAAASGRGPYNPAAAYGGAAPPMSTGLFGVPGAFGYAPFDNSGSMQNSLFNYGNEGGVKYYVVMCKDDVEVRASPTYADDTRIGHFLHPGQVVVIDDRRMVTGSWFLHLADGRGWVFEAKERLLVMTQAHDFERGLWHYAVSCEDDVETRLTPTYSDDSRTGVVIGSGDCCAVDERCNVAGARFLKLADGRGWVFETKDRLLVMSEVRAKAQEARDFARGLWHYTVVCDDDVEIRAAPTYSDEARTGLTVHPGDCVAVDERCRIAAVWFLRLADGRGWVFESKDSRRVMIQLH